MAAEDTEEMAAEVMIDANLSPEAQRFLDRHGPWSRLTRSERAVAELLALGASCRQIAAQLGRHQKTVEKHRESVLDKYGLSGQPALARLAIREGWAPVAESPWERKAARWGSRTAVGATHGDA